MGFTARRSMGGRMSVKIVLQLQLIIWNYVALGMLDDTRDKRDERDSRDKCQRIVLHGETIFSIVFGLYFFFNTCVVKQELASVPATTLFASSIHDQQIENPKTFKSETQMRGLHLSTAHGTQSRMIPALDDGTWAS